MMLNIASLLKYPFFDDDIQNVKNKEANWTKTKNKQNKKQPKKHTHENMNGGEFDSSDHKTIEPQNGETDKSAKFSCEHTW